MKKFCLLSALTILMTAFSHTPSTAAESQTSPVSMSWELIGNDSKQYKYHCVFTLKNISKKTLSDDWKIYYNSFPRTLIVDKDCPVEFSEVMPGYYKITPKKGFKLAPGATKEIKYAEKGSLKSISYAPDGGHFAFLSDSIARPLDIVRHPIEWGTFPVVAGYPTAERVFERNAEVNPADSPSQQNFFDILPAPKQVTAAPDGKGTNLAAAMIVYTIGGNLERESRYAAEKLRPEANAANTVEVYLELISSAEAKNQTAASNPEYYEMTLNDGRIDIRGISPDAVMNGIKTLAKLVEQNAGNSVVPNAEICDWPDLNHRGMMLDIVRNYSKPDDVKRLIDKLATLKLNKLHFHITDDEAWRIEIPGLPELTEVGGRRGMTETEDEYLCQIYAGNGNPNDPTTTSNGYLTREDFIDLLRYAYARGVEIIPEIESPGHARAAIMSMKVRYNRLIDTNPEAAEQYRLWDPDDTSKYTSAQGYHDNVLNPALEGTYRFMEKVIDEIILMYREAGVTLPYIHVGGDEVPRNPWAESPAVQKMMAEKGMKTTHDVEEYFICRIADIVAEKGYRMGGWQEAAMNHSEATDKKLRPLFAGINCWSTVPESRRDTIPYSIANDGYNVILSNVTNFYIDMAYNPHPDEPGLTWGGYVDEFRTWDARPFDIYKSTWTTVTGSPLDPKVTAAKKIELLPEAKKRIVGVQAHLFAETIRNFDMVEYYVFPKIFGLAERGWNADLLPGQTKAAYNHHIGNYELPALEREGINFHIGMPGIKEENGMLFMNKQYDNAEIRYTTDGSEPTAQSTLWTEPVKATGKVVKAKMFYLGKESKTTRLDR